MLKKTIQYEDLDGNQVVKDFYFNLTKAELVEQQLVDGHDDLRALIRQLMEAKQNKQILEHFKTLLASTVGRRVGDRFVKDEETRSAFMDTNAYGEVVFEFFKDANTLTEFFKGVIPKDLGEKLPNELPSSLEELDKVEPLSAKDFGHVKESPTKLEGKLEVRDLTLGAQSVFPGAEIVEVTQVENETGGFIFKPVEELTKDDLLKMPVEQFVALFGKNPKHWTKPILTAAMIRGDVQK